MRANAQMRWNGMEGRKPRERRGMGWIELRAREEEKEALFSKPNIGKEGGAKRYSSTKAPRRVLWHKLKMSKNIYNTTSSES